MDDEIILEDDPRAAQPHTLHGWMSRNGVFYCDEETARSLGATHVRCSGCGTVFRKGGWSVCPSCRDKAEAARYAALPRAEWDGVCMLYSEVKDYYYSTPQDAIDALDDDESLSDLRLVLCEPNYATQLDADHYADDMTEDGDLPPEVADAMDAYNAAVKGIVLSWSPGKVALKENGNG